MRFGNDKMSCSDTIPDIEIKCSDSNTEEFIKQLRTQDFDRLKWLLKRFEEKEFYESCRLIQNEIDARVK